MSAGVCVLGDTAVDLIIHLPEMKMSEKVMPYAPCLYPGGSGANTAVALARLGNPTSFIGTVGDDQYGRTIVDDFKKEHVDITQLFIEPQLSTVCVFAFVDKDGERYLWGWPREKQAYSDIKFKKLDLERIRAAGWLHTTGLLLGNESSGRDAVLQAFEWAHKNNVITSFDLNLRSSTGAMEKTYREVVDKTISNSDYVLGSEQEFALLSEAHAWEKAVDELTRHHKIVIVRQGEKGSILFVEDEYIKVPAFNVRVADTVGAGDVFDAGFITALRKGHDFTAALQWGNAVSAFTIMNEGARTTPTFLQLEDFLGKQKINVRREK